MNIIFLLRQTMSIKNAEGKEKETRNATKP